MGTNALVRFEAGAALSRADIGRLCRLARNQETEIARLRGEVQQLSDTLAAANIAAPELPKPSPSIARDAARGAAALAIAATRRENAAADEAKAAMDPPGAAEPQDEPLVLLPQDIYCDRLTFIKGLDIDAAALLASLGVTRFADIKAFTPEDVCEIDRLLGAPGRVSKQGWIEQAALLAAGKTTLYSRLVEGGRIGPQSAGAQVIDLARARRKSTARSRATVAARATGLGLLAASAVLFASFAWYAPETGWQDAWRMVTASLL